MFPGLNIKFSSACYANLSPPPPSFFLRQIPCHAQPQARPERSKKTRALAMTGICKVGERHRLVT